MGIPMGMNMDGYGTVIYPNVLVGILWEFANGGEIQ